jgi:hypothetical protein
MWPRRRLGQVEAYLTLREVLTGASKGADGVLWREFTGFGRFRFATLGFTLKAQTTLKGKDRWFQSHQKGSG